jgi:hypothetical protein
MSYIKTDEKPFQLKASAWTVEVHLVDMMGSRPKQVITRDAGEDVGTVLQLAQIGARFVLDGYTWYSGKPLVDPIERKLIYYCEGCKD